MEIHQADVMIVVAAIDSRSLVFEERENGIDFKERLAVLMSAC